MHAQIFSFAIYQDHECTKIKKIAISGRFSAYGTKPSIAPHAILKWRDIKNSLTPP